MSDNRNVKLLSLLLALLIVLVLNFNISIVSASGPTELRSDVVAKNITRTDGTLEVNPSFVGNGSSIVYLEFTGDPVYPKPWNYRLALTDRTGITWKALSEPGVVDYSVLPGGSEILYLSVTQNNDPLPEINHDTEEYYDLQVDWQVYQLNLRTEKKTTVATGTSPLVDGCRLLKQNIAPDLASKQLVTVSPDGSYRLQIVRENQGAGDVIAGYLIDKEQRQPAWTTDGYMTHTHLSWMPQVLWLDDDSMITLMFDSFNDPAFPQSDGEFAIVRVDLETPKLVELYRSDKIKPFPRLSLDAARATVFFQEAGPEGVTQLCRLNLGSGERDIIYVSEGSLGEARASFDGTSLVLTELRDVDFEIIRLDLDVRPAQSLVRTELE